MLMYAVPVPDIMGTALPAARIQGARVTDQDLQEKRALEAVVRGMSAAAKSLRLYPSSSPIPRQAADGATAALAGWFESETVLPLAIGRDGLTYRGETVAPSSPGASDLAAALRSHGVAEIDFTPGCSTEDLVTFLSLVMGDPEQTRVGGGLAALLASAGVETIRATDVHLTVLEDEAVTPDSDVDEFFRQLAEDPDKLTAWLAAMAKRDPSALEDGLAELAAAAGPQGMEKLAANLATAFAAQDAAGKDAVFGVSMEAGVPRDIMGKAFAALGAGELAGALTGGLYGGNMLSLSSAMNKLPFAERLDQILEEVRASLPTSGHTSKEGEFLEHMMDVHARTEPEVALADADQSYRAVAQAAQVTEEEAATARLDTASSAGHVAARAVTTMLGMLDQQEDYDLYCRGVDNLAAMVPKLVEDGDVKLATRVLSELHSRAAAAVQPWPDLDARLRTAISTATGKRAMSALLAAVIADRSALGPAKEFARMAGDGADAALAEEALAHKAEGLAAAEELVGRRIVDMLAAAVPHAQWFQLGPMVARLARESDPRAVDAIRQAMARPDDQSRREVAQGLAEAGTPQAVRNLVTLTRDPSAEVAIVAFRALGKAGGPDSGRALGARLQEMDVDGKDFLLAREAIGALARVADQSADDALKQLAGRKTLIKRGHFAEVQDLVRQAIEYRAKQGGGGR